MRNAIATALAAGLGIGAFALATEGFRAFTAEAARRLEVERAPRAIPEALFEDAAGGRFRASDLRGRRVAVSFVYTRCPGVCRRSAAELTQLADRLARGTTGRGTALVTVSFDPERDGLRELRAWAGVHRADGERWRVVRPPQAADLAAWLEAFGVVVIPDGFGGFVHNAALHLVDERGRLVRILDLGQLDEAQRFLEGQLVRRREAWARR